jgi:hypothetical protein
MDMSAFTHANRRSRQPELRALMARITSLQAVSPTAKATMVTPCSDPLNSTPEKSIDALMVPTANNRRDLAAPTSFNSGIAEALLTQAKGS